MNPTRAQLRRAGFRPDGKGGLRRVKESDSGGKNFQTPQCSTGTSQSRPFPARPGNGVASAGHYAKETQTRQGNSVTAGETAPPQPDWTTDAICIRLPHPPAAVRPNARNGHWCKRHRAVKAYRALAAAEARIVCGLNPPRWERATVEVEWRSRTLIAPDPDNVLASMKAALDGLQDAHVIVNDRGLTPERPKIRTRQPHPEVVLIVRGEG